MDDAHMLVLDMGSRHYSCAQIVMTGGLRLMGRDNPDLIRAMAGLAQGVGYSGEICGALAGGICLVALHTAKCTDDEETLPEARPLMNTLVEWFREEHCKGGAITCDALLAEERAGGDGVGAHGGMHAAICGELVASVWNKTIVLLAENGIDPSLGREIR
ncbi:MAG: C-GCAxxG-C-C family protein [Desulfovibrio sp.]|jgi:C_GCAxxG_C_C family probable redox protein|nr:C-GCAxxG-C-C family protein [Desulfovibrio sp.]